MILANATNPIGIFDSGIGGLTIASALIKQLPSENIIYFGDTAHLPYGDKSTASIQAYSVKIAHMLLQQKCKMILIACNSASAAAYELVKEYVADAALVINVIDPVVKYLNLNYVGKHIGLIGTKQTVNSNIYKKKIDCLNANITVTSRVTNLLASAIEEFGSSKIINALLEEYLNCDGFETIEALVLACTHYPIIKKNIIEFYADKMPIIDPSDIVAKAVSEKLKAFQLLNTGKQGKKTFYVSDYTDAFAAGTQLFFTDDIHLEHYPLWD